MSGDRSANATAHGTTMVRGRHERRHKVVRNRLLQPSHGTAHGRGTLRKLSECNLSAHRLGKEILDGSHRVGPFMHMMRYAQRERGLPPLDQSEGKAARQPRTRAHVVDGATMNISRTLEARSVT